MSYFDCFEEFEIVRKDGRIEPCMDEWYDGMQLSDKLRQALIWEENENYEEFQ